jgi:ribonuclease HII
MSVEPIDYNTIYKGYVFIDESGTGCIAGPAVVTGLKITGEVSFAEDSKKLSSKQREDMVEKIKLNSEFFTVITTAKEIDDFGLPQMIKKSLELIINKFGNDEKYLYDGNRMFGVENLNLETLVKADALVKGVGAASIIAKHTKDLLMLEHHKIFPQYNFVQNAGYATKQHIELIKKHGYCELHRMSYKVKELVEWENKKMVDVLF